MKKVLLIVFCFISWTVHASESAPKRARTVAAMTLSQATTRRDTPAMKASIKRDKTQLNKQDGAGVTALMTAARNGDHRGVTLLLAQGANTEIQDNAGESAIM